MRFIPVLMLLATIAGNAEAQRVKKPRLDIHGDPLPDGAIARLGTVRFRPHGHIRSTTLSPDGTTVVTAIQGGTGPTRIEFMDSSTGKHFRTLEVTDTSAEKVQFTPDGKSLVLNGYSGITLLDEVTGKLIKVLNIADTWDVSTTLASEGNWIAAQPEKFVYHAPVGIWETSTGKEVAMLPGRGASCKGLAFGPKGKRLLVWSIVPDDVDDSAQPGRVVQRSMSFGPNSKVALACIDVVMRKVVGETRVGTTQRVALCPDGETVACDDSNHERVRVRHLPTGAERCVIPVKRAHFAFSPDGKALLAINHKGQTALWDATTGKKIRELEGALVSDDFRIVGFSRDGKTVAVLDGHGQSDATVIVWNALTGKRGPRPTGHEGTVTCLAYTPDGKLLVSGSADRTVRLWKPTGEHIRILAEHTDPVTALAISPSGELVASSSKYGEIRLSRLADGKNVAQFTGPPAVTTALTFSPDGKVLLAGGSEGKLLGWDITIGKEVVRINTGHRGAVMAFAEGGAAALLANDDLPSEVTPERMEVWDTQSRSKLVSIPFRTEMSTLGWITCNAAAFSPRGRVIASSQLSTHTTMDERYGKPLLRLWERSSGQPILTLSPSVTRVLAFSHTGRLLAAGGTGPSEHFGVPYGSGIDVWDTLTGKKAAALPVTPEAVAFSPDGKYLATGGREHGILVWESPRVDPPDQGKVPSAAERDAWWGALDGQAADAYRAVGQMVDAPEQAVALLKERVQPIRPADPSAVAKLLAQLDSNKFAERKDAESALEQMSEGAAPFMATALEGKVSLEARRRLEELQRKCDAASPRSLREQRAIAALEWIATPAARELLRSLAGGPPRARLTVAAQAALQRLQN
jgi:WD40 repeat protein